MPREECFPGLEYRDCPNFQMLALPIDRKDTLQVSRVSSSRLAFGNRYHAGHRTFHDQRGARESRVSAALQEDTVLVNSAYPRLQFDAVD